MSLHNYTLPSSPADEYDSLCNYEQDSVAFEDVQIFMPRKSKFGVKFPKAATTKPTGRVITRVRDGGLTFGRRLRGVGRRYLSALDRGTDDVQPLLQKRVPGPSRSLQRHAAEGDDDDDDDAAWDSFSMAGPDNDSDNSSSRASVNEDDGDTGLWDHDAEVDGDACGDIVLPDEQACQLEEAAREEETMDESDVADIADDASSEGEAGDVADGNDSSDDDGELPQLEARTSTLGNFVDCVYQPGLPNDDPLINNFMQVGFTTQSSFSSMSQIMRHFFSNIEEYYARYKAGELRCHEQYRRIMAKNLPNIYFEYVTRKTKEPHTIRHHVNCLSIAAHPGEEMLYTIGLLEMMDLVDFHKKIHHQLTPVHPQGLPVHLFVDNIQESKSNARSVCVYALKFLDCALTYPICIVRPVKSKDGIDYETILKKLISDIHGSGMRIVHVIADAPKRGELRCVKQHQSDVACDYCKGSVTKLRNSANKIIGKAWLVTGAPLRTRAWMRQVLDNWWDYTEEERFGIKSESPLFTIPGFDPIHGMPPEYMHSMCLGVTRLLTELTMDVNKKTISKNASFERIPVAKFDEALQGVLVPQEFSRRVRHLDPAVWKAEEYRNLVLFFFPAVINMTKFPAKGNGSSLGSLRTMSSVTTRRSDRMTAAQKAAAAAPNLVMWANHHVRMLWHILAFLLRFYTLPDAEYDQSKRKIGEDYRVMLQNRFVRLLAKTHGAWNCPYNVHHVTHLHLMRKAGPFWHTSAFYGECMFSKLQRVARPESRNPVKVQFQSVFSSWTGGHACQKSLLITKQGKSEKCDDSLFYTFHEGHYVFYKAVSAERASITAHKIHLGRHVDTQRYGDFSWARVGVFTFVRVRDEEDPVVVQRESISGKAIIVLDLIMTVANGLLRETATI